MIGRLRGELVTRQPPTLLVEVGGIGYEVEAPMSTIYDLPRVGSQVVLLIHYAQKDDGVTLYGFATEAERGLFRNLLKVSGIGAKIALAVLSGVSTAEFARLVGSGDVASLTRIPGIGKKTAERIVVELRDRLGDADTGEVGSATRRPQDPQSEAVIALQQLGYKPVDASRLVRGAAADGDDAEAIIRKSLRAALGN